jgi:hypothetical protein
LCKAASQEGIVRQAASYKKYENLLAKACEIENEAADRQSKPAI